MFELKGKLELLEDWDCLEVSEYDIKLKINDLIAISITKSNFSGEYNVYSMEKFNSVSCNSIDNVIHVITNWLKIVKNLYLEISEEFNDLQSEISILVKFYLLKTPSGRTFEWKSNGIFPKKTILEKGFLGMEKERKETDEERHIRHTKIVESLNSYKLCQQWTLEGNDEYFEEIKKNRKL